MDFVKKKKRRCYTDVEKTHKLYLHSLLINPLNPTVKPWVIQSFLAFDSKPYSVTIHWKAVEQYFILVLFVFQFYTLWSLKTNFSLNSRLGTVRSERLKRFV